MIYNCQLTVLPLEGKHAIKRQLYNRLFACLAHNCTEHTPFGSEPTPQKTIYTNYTWYCRVQRGKHPIRRKTTTLYVCTLVNDDHNLGNKGLQDSIVAQTAHGFSWQWVTVSGLISCATRWIEFYRPPPGTPFACDTECESGVPPLSPQERQSGLVSLLLHRPCR